MGMEISSVDGEEEEEEEEMGVMVEEGGEQQHQGTDEVGRDLRALKARPGILLVGASAVGKRSLLNRLVARGRSVQATSESGATCQGWTIDTKYYTANVCMWMARLGNPTLADAASIQSEFGHCEALVMVFDLSSPNSFEQLQEWVTGVDLGNFEILLCVGNKADRVPEHFGHAEYRRKLQKSGESSSDPHPEFWDFGINRTEGTSLLDEEVVSEEDRRRLCIEWCSDRGFEYIEACALNEIFDECMSVDGDLQGLARIHGALSAHMWPGLVMKDESEGDGAAASSNQEQKEMTSDDDSDYYIEYELLSNGSAEPWEGSEWEEQWSFSPHREAPAPEANHLISDSTGQTPPNLESDNQQNDDTATTSDSEVIDRSVVEAAQAPQMQTASPEISYSEHFEHPGGDQTNHGDQEVLPSGVSNQGGHKNQEIDDMEQLMGEMATMRLNMQSMSDQQRREVAAQLAMRMASMFKEDEDGASDLE